MARRTSLAVLSSKTRPSTVRDTGRISSAKARAVATELHRETAARSNGSGDVIITRRQTATGRGAVRFRAAHIVHSHGLVRTTAKSVRSSKSKYTR
jgi:hypothetical protein